MKTRAVPRNRTTAQRSPAEGQERDALKAYVRQLGEFETPLLANTIGYIDPTPPEQLYMGGSIRCVTPALAPTVGVAVTCEIDTSTPGGKSDMNLFWTQLEEIQAAGLPAVWVVKCVGSRPDHECIMGDGMGKLLHSAGCVGVVTDGGVRDVTALLTVPIAVYCRGFTVHHTAIRFRSINRPVHVGGIAVRPGDVVHANAEGVILVPPPCLPTLPSRAIQMRAFEYEAHLIFRRTDLTFAEKQSQVAEALSRYGFTHRSASAASSGKQATLRLKI